jgi:hypothetical protein
MLAKVAVGSGARVRGEGGGGSGWVFEVYQVDVGLFG